MAQSVFFVHFQFGHGLTYFRDKKDRVISKPVRAALIGNNFPITLAKSDM